MFQNLAEINPPPSLKKAILKEIEIEKEKKARFGLLLLRSSLAFSGLLFLFSYSTFSQAFFSSDFWSMLKLLFSDFNVVAQYYNEFFISLLENFPTASAIAILLPVFIFFLSLSYYKEHNNKHNHKYV